MCKHVVGTGFTKSVADKRRCFGSGRSKVQYTLVSGYKLARQDSGGGEVRAMTNLYKSEWVPSNLVV